MADKVMRMAETTSPHSASAPHQCQCALCSAVDSKTVQPGQSPSGAVQRSSTGAAPLSIARQGVKNQEEEEFPHAAQGLISRKAEFAEPHSAAEPTSGLADRLAERQGGGEALPATARQSMETAFGYDFSRVRVHRDAEAGEISHQLSAQAFTHGNHIYFGRGMYDPDGSSGKRLLAHELTHVVQQGQASPRQSSDATSSTAVARAATPEIQRTATWAAGPVHEVNNLANSLLHGPPVGVTWPTLNGRTFWSTAETRAQIQRPTLAFASAASGGVDARVATVPTNTGSFDETVLAPGPWTMTVPKATVGAQYPTLAQCAGADNTNFRAIGMPSDADMFAANRRHEDHHATDHRDAFNATVVPWDTRLAAAQTAGTTYNGADEAAAEAALHTAMGGTPDQIADALFNACQAAVIAYHGTAAGGPVTAANPTANADCTTSSVESSNPS